MNEATASDRYKGKREISMVSPTENRSAPTLLVGSGVPFWAGAITFAAAGAVLVGWTYDIRILKQPLPAVASMKANTALALAILGVSLCLTTIERCSNRAKARILWASVAILALLTLSQDVVGWNFGIDEALFWDPQPVATHVPGRMAPMTAVCLFMIAIALISSTTCRGSWVAQTSALVTALISLIALLGYLYDVRALYGISSYTTMAVHTASLLLILSIGVLYTQPRQGFMVVVLEEGFGASTARRLLPPMVLGPVVLGWLRLAGERAGFYSTEFGLALMVTSTISLTSLAIWLSARSLNRIDRERRQVNEDLRQLTSFLEIRVEDATRNSRRAEQKFRQLLECAPDAMIVVDRKGRIVLGNTQATTMFGCTANELTGQAAEVLVPNRFHERYFRLRAQVFAQPTVRPMRLGHDLCAVRKDGSEFPAEISLSPVMFDDGILVTAAIRDISDRKAAEQRLKDSLGEKEALLKEVHHRVKNNLQIVSSLLRLQAKKVHDHEALRVLHDSEERVLSMALLHENLYRSDDLGRVDVVRYLRSLSNELVTAYEPARGRVSLTTGSDIAELDIQQALPIGLLVNELVTNALKHAFPDGRSGQIRVWLSRAAGTCVLIVKDDGVGLPGNAKDAGSNSLGMELVNALSLQLRGQYVYEGSTGTEFRLQFPHATTPLERV